MADPTIQTFCCHYRNHSSTTVKLLSEFSKESYVTICLFSSALGIVGSLYQIFLRKEDEYTEVNGRRIIKTGRRISVWLAIADLCASLGIFLRSAVWRKFQTMFPNEDDTSSVIFCAISSGWSQYFYTCTWIWTCCYAINTHKTLHKKQVSQNIFHMVTWSLAALLTGMGLFVLYYPDANCHEISYLSTALMRILPNYCATYLPIAVVMIVNPILYILSTNEIDRQLSLTLNQVTIRERELLRIFKIKFSFINIVFYICWLPNLINGIILWTSWHKLPTEFIVLLWYVMAITNPLQAFFNALVYRKWDRNRYFRTRAHLRSAELYNAALPNKLNERAPLLQVQHQTTTSLAEDTKIDTKFSVNSCWNT